MRHLIVMRHAKSSWTSNAPTDHERPLNRRGQRDAPRVAQELVRIGWAPELVLSSNSARTRQTFEGMADYFGPDVLAHFTPDFYHAGHHAVCTALTELNPAQQTVMVLGHNPGWEEATQWLCGESVVLKTANAALLKTSADTWQAAVGQPGQFSLHRVIVSRNLGSK